MEIENDIDSREVLRVLGERPASNAETHECHIELAVAHCEDPQSVLTRCREVLVPVLEQLTAVESGAARPSLDAWRRRLPTWFVDVCAPEPSDTQRIARAKLLKQYPAATALIVRRHAPWPLSTWTATLLDDRPWFWWDAEVVAPDRLKVWHAVWDHPYAEGSLRWLLLAAGASAVELEWQA